MPRNIVNRMPMPASSVISSKDALIIGDPSKSHPTSPFVIESVQKCLILQSDTETDRVGPRIIHRNTFDYGRSAASRNNPLFEFLKAYISHSDISCKPSSSETYASHSK